MESWFTTRRRESVENTRNAHVLNRLRFEKRTAPDTLALGLGAERCNAVDLASGVAPFDVLEAPASCMR